MALKKRFLASLVTACVYILCKLYVYLLFLVSGVVLWFVALQHHIQAKRGYCSILGHFPCAVHENFSNFCVDKIYR